MGDDAKDLFRKLKRVSFEVDCLGMDQLEKLEKEIMQVPQMLKQLQEEVIKDFSEQFKLKL